MSNIKTIVVHNGGFHADDVFATATLFLLFEREGFTPKIIRTREQSIIEKGDYVADVGAIHDPETNRFDHHQEGGAGIRENGIPYAAFGLVWKKYGAIVCDSEEIAKRIEQKIVMPFDALDNGVSISTPIFDNVRNYDFTDFLLSFRPTWKESEESMDIIFEDAVRIALQVLRREIEILKHEQEAGVLIQKTYNDAPDKRLIVLDTKVPWEAVSTSFAEPLFFVFPYQDVWKVNAVRKSPNTFELRKELPIEWAGKRDRELQDVTGVADATFCHNKRFLVVAKSKEGALALAKIAIDR